MKMTRVAVTVALIGALLTGCANNQYGQKQTGGAVIGGVLGGLLGSQIGGGSGKLAATAGLAILGVILGSEAGKSLDRADAVYVHQTTQRSLEYNPVGRPMSWHNPNTQVYTTVTPTQTYQHPNGRYCREFQQDITIHGKTERAYGRACRQPDGTWQIVNDQSSSVNPTVTQQHVAVIHQAPPVFVSRPAPVVYYHYVPNLSIGYQRRLMWERRHAYRTYW